MSIFFSVSKIHRQMLLFSPAYDTCLKDTIFLINQLAKKGQKVSKDKTQLWQQEAKYLRYMATLSGSHVNTYHSSAIRSLPSHETNMNN